MTDKVSSVTDLLTRLQKREHYFRNAVEGEYDANLLMKARFEIEALRSSTPRTEDAETVRLAAQIVAKAGEKLDTESGLFVAALNRIADILEGK